MDSERDFSSDSECDEIQFVCTILQPFQLELVFTSAEIQAKTDLAGTSAQSLTSSYVTEFDAQPTH